MALNAVVDRKTIALILVFQGWSYLVVPVHPNSGYGDMASSEARTEMNAVMLYFFDLDTLLNDF